ncbi:cohesin domain-containing protein [Paenibacillus sp. MSJ-34]|uniref:cohesin domain-containing protein n=1 Tax=Paenibacillus sp. MSJ-34 TaxID=2841529 RepID=UPI003461343D
MKDPGFDSHTFNEWSKSSSSGDANHIAMTVDGNGDGQLQIKGSGDATVSQPLTGLTPGKYYTASVWGKVDGVRKTSITVQQGEDKATNWMDNTSHQYLAQQHKYVSTHFQRIKVTFQAKSDIATLLLQAEAGDATVTLDDVRVWENPSHTAPAGAVLYEDFENVDEGWGPFVYSKLGPVRTHLVESNGNQYMSYVLEGRYSLKTNESGTGEWLRTLPQTLRLEANTTYRLTMDYNAETKDMYSVAVRVKEGSAVRDLTQTTLDAGKGKLDVTFTTDEGKEPYLAIIKNFTNNNAELTGTLVVDNIRVVKGGGANIAPVVKEEIADRTIALGSGNVAIDISGTFHDEDGDALTYAAASSDETKIAVSVEGEAVVLRPVAAGRAIITVTADDGGGGTASAEFQATVTATSDPAATLTGPGTVQAGQPFAVTYGLANVSQHVYAQDITIRYDSGRLEFDSAASLRDGMEVIETAAKPGEVRLIAVSLGPDHAVVGGDVLELRWKAKPLSEPATGTIEVAQAVIADEKGNETTIEGTQHAVRITVTDKRALSALIAEAQSVHDAAEEGTGVGQYPAGSKAILQSAIDAAKAVADRAEASQEEIDAAEAALRAALNAFKESVHSGVPGDLNGDGKVSIGDLAIVAAHYGKTSSSPDWNIAKKADMNGDGKIDIDDLAAVAKLILQ